MVKILGLLTGLALLVLGHRLFWLFVAGIGFTVGFFMASQLFKAESELVALLIGLFFGLLGIWLAQAIQRLAVVLAGLLTGGYLTYALLDWLGLVSGVALWLLVLTGGLIGIALMAAVFDWALIVLSALMGAVLIIQALDLKVAATPLVFLILLVTGVLVQGKFFQRRRPKRPPPGHYDR